jgi:hypothetical protein
MSPGNYNVSFIDVDQKPKTIRLFMNEEHVRIFRDSNYRCISGFETKAGQGVPKIICLSATQMAILELDRTPQASRGF